MLCLLRPSLFHPLEVDLSLWMMKGNQYSNQYLFLHHLLLSIYQSDPSQHNKRLQRMDSVFHLFKITPVTIYLPLVPGGQPEAWDISHNIDDTRRIFLSLCLPVEKTNHGYHSRKKSNHSITVDKPRQFFGVRQSDNHIIQYGSIGRIDLYSVITARLIVAVLIHQIHC